MRVARWGALAFIAGWLLIWWVKVLTLNVIDADRDIYTSRGYLQTVELFIRHGWIRYNDTSGQIEKTFSDDSPMDEFYRRSYLRGDVRDFNNGDRTRFRIENGQIVGIDRYAHNISLPFREVEGWRGNLTYRPVQDTRALLRGKNKTIALQTPQSDLSTAVGLPIVTLKDQGQNVASRRYEGEAFELVGDNQTQNGLYFGKVHLIGDQMIFNNRNAENSVDVSISGQPVLQGRRMALDTGDLIKFEWPATDQSTRYALLWSTVTEDAPIISHYRFVNGSWGHAPAEPKPLLMADLVRGLNQTFWARDDQEGLAAFDLALTLDAQIQERSQELLLNYCRTLRRQGDADAPPFRAAITVMDANTGELLALASYPEDVDLSNEATSANARARLLRNHNFSRRPIGSVAKVLFSAAILDREPRLAELSIPGYGEAATEDILGIKISPMNDPAVWGRDTFEDQQWISFDQYMERSSNRYAAVLLTLATGMENGRFEVEEGELNTRLRGEQRFRMGSRVYTQRPKLRLDLRNDPEPDSELAMSRLTSRLEFESHAEGLYDLFGVRTTRVAAVDRGRGDDLYDTSMWLPLLNYLYPAGDIPRDHAFYGVSPERENLAYNLLKDYRADYLSLILGGGNSTWTNVKVAESFARLTTGRKVEGSIIKRIATPGLTSDVETPAFGELGMNAGARIRLMDSMTRVAGPAGTAARLNQMLDQFDAELAKDDKALGFFSKTGSPDNVFFVPTRTAFAVNRLIRNGALQLGADGKVHYRDQGPVTRAREQGSRRLRFAQALRRNREDSRVLARYRVDPRTVVFLCDRHNDPDRRSPFRISNGRLASLDNREQVETIGAAFAFTIGVYDQAAIRDGNRNNAYLPRINVVDHLPERALSVSMVIETRGDGPTVAVPLAQELIEEVLWDALRNGW